MKIARTESFKKDYLSLPDDVRKAASRQITQLLMDHNHPSLRLKGISGRKGLFSICVNIRYRISLNFEEAGTILLRRILDHDDLYKTP